MLNAYHNTWRTGIFLFRIIIKIRITLSLYAQSYPDLFLGIKKSSFDNEIKEHVLFVNHPGECAFPIIPYSVSTDKTISVKR